VNSITFDNGKEFSQHEKVAETLECKTYFTTPYRSWERGQNENVNGYCANIFQKQWSWLMLR